MGRRLCGLIAIDARSLAAFRVAIGAIVLVDMAIRAGDFAAHYTEAGVLPFAALRETIGRDTWRWSLYVLSTAEWWPVSLMAATAVCGGLLVLGLATRVATLLAWVLLLSLHNRMPVITNAGDTLLHALLLWAIFLPLSARWSVDASLRSRWGAGAPRSTAACSPASAAILLQMALLYVAAGLFKLSNPDWWAGLSLHYVMSFDAYARPAAAWALQYPESLKYLTWATLVLEIGGPLAAFCPWFTGPIRLAVIASFLAFHLGIEATMTVGLFSWVSAAGWLLFLPGAFWERLAKLGRGARRASQPDRAIPAGSRTSAGSAARSGLTPAGIASGVLVFVLLGATIYWNITGLPFATGRSRGAWCRPIMELSGLRQEWRMFTRPPKHDGWPRVVAQLSDGAQWDLLEDAPGFDWKRRQRPAAIAPNHRWRKYYNVVMRRDYAHLRPYFCRYLAKQFEAHHSRSTREVLLYQVQEITGEPGEGSRLIRRLLHREAIRSQGAFLDAAELDAAGKVQRNDAEIHPGI